MKKIIIFAILALFATVAKAQTYPKPGYISRKGFMRHSVFLIFLLCIMSCCTNTIVEPDVSEITIENRETGLNRLITDKDSIDKIVSIINSSRIDFCIFMAPKEMTLKYKSKKNVSVLISKDGHYLKIDGRSYVNSCGL